jgi:hypothetical protein
MRHSVYFEVWSQPPLAPPPSPDSALEMLLFIPHESLENVNAVNGGVHVWIASLRHDGGRHPVKSYVVGTIIGP